MVARRTDAALTTTDRIADASARIEELARANGRPTQALRNPVGHVLDMPAASATPMLLPRVAGDDAADQALDSALRFQDGALSVRNPTDTAYRDFQARTINATGSIGSDLNLVAKGGLLGTYATINGDIHANGGSVIGAFVKSTGNILANGQINADGSIGAGLNLVAANAVLDSQGNVRVAPACERRLKRHVSDLPDPLAVVEQWRPAISTWADESIRAQRGDDPFAAVYVDEVADTAPEVVYDRGDGTRTTDDRGLIAYLVGSVQQLAADNRALAARVAELEGAR